MHRNFDEVEGWMYWSVLTLARRYTSSIEVAHRTAQLGLIRLWRGSDSEDVDFVDETCHPPFEN